MKIKINIEREAIGSSETYTYPIDMSQVKIIKYADDMSYCIAEADAILPGTTPITEEEWRLPERLKELKEYRQKIEFGGFTMPDGTFLETAREDQRKVDAAVMGVERNPETIINFKTTSGYIQLNAEQMLGIGQAMFEHVQACHTRERELTEALKLDINTDITTGWPE